MAGMSPSRSLLGELAESSEVRSVLQPFNKKVHVIRHEAVRRKLKRLNASGVLKLLQRRATNAAVAKCVMAWTPSLPRRKV
jgi:hypothetical protein